MVRGQQVFHPLLLPWRIGVVFFDLTAEFFSDGGAPVRLCTRLITLVLVSNAAYCDAAA